MLSPRSESKLPRTLHLALFAIGLLWLLASRVGAESAATGISRAVGSDLIRPLLSHAFLLILLFTGFTALNWVGTRNGSVRATNALPTRPTAPREWQKGAALGWAMVLIAVLPMALLGDLHPAFWFAPRAWGLTLLSLVAVLLWSLAIEVAFRGFLFQRLISAVGAGTATVLLSGIYALVSTSLLNTTPFSFVNNLVIGFLFSIAYLRTHGIWLGWGLRFGWMASMGILFGLPVAGTAELANVVATNSSGRAWVTGGAYGPEGALFTVLVLFAGIIALYAITRDYAWVYTHAPIVPGGYPMDVPPPAAHAAMEAAPVAKSAPLVQISGITSVIPAMMPGSALPANSRNAVDGGPEYAPTFSGVPADPHSKAEPGDTPEQMD